MDSGDGLPAGGRGPPRYVLGEQRSLRGGAGGRRHGVGKAGEGSGIPGYHRKEERKWSRSLSERGRGGERSKLMDVRAEEEDEM